MQPVTLFAPLLNQLPNGPPASPFRLRRRIGPRPAPLGGGAMEKADWGGPFCRARAEVLSPARRGVYLLKPFDVRRTADHVGLVVLQHVP